MADPQEAVLSEQDARRLIRIASRMAAEYVLGCIDDAAGGARVEWRGQFHVLKGFARKMRITVLECLRDWPTVTRQELHDCEMLRADMQSNWPATERCLVRLLRDRGMHVED